ncbi:hypothetical protein BDZ94DRAFT_1163969, partial [Collybia nuda]
PQVTNNTAEAAYWYALMKVGAIYHLDRHLFVVQDWNSSSEMLQIGTYYHVVRLPWSANEYGVMCTCPVWKAQHMCIHQQITANHVHEMEGLVLLAPTPLPPAILVHSTPFHDVHIFSCTSSDGGRYESSKRVIVSFQRTGRWHCQSCRYSDTCKHWPHAINFALEAGLILEGTNMPVMSIDAADDVENILLMQAVGCDDGLGQHGCISHLPVNHAVPSLCAPTIHHAILFDLTNKFNVTIELAACPICQHNCHFMGPDLGAEGIFNWNNTMLFTHELLNGFTNMYTASETPFSAFCLTISRTYMKHGPKVKFCSDDTFVRVWFAFIHLQELDSGMKCPTCGPSPKIIIADGISLGIHAAKVTPSTCPPTLTSAGSPQIESISSYKARSLPAVVQPDVHTTILKLLDVSTSHVPCEMPNTQKLQTLYPALYDFIALYFSAGLASLHHNPYRGLFQQISAPDIILQLIPQYAIEVLWSIAKSDPASNVPEWIQFLVPAFGRAYPKLQYDSSTMDCDAEEMGDCNKFYKTYSKNSLTGGILVLWCTHAICLGFHSIPVAEGRNDVFSAIYTRFPIAPKVVVYDFACQLVPYCLVQEACYFGNTQFFIDEMHAHDHTCCGQACFASNYMQFDDRI